MGDARQWFGPHRSVPLANDGLADVRCVQWAGKLPNRAVVSNRKLKRWATPNNMMTQSQNR
jgi:hypothetical protein